MNLIAVKKVFMKFLASALGVILSLVNYGSSGSIVPAERDAASAGSYPIVGTSQTGLWDSDGNKIDAPAKGEAFYGQDAQFSSIQPVYTASSDGLTVKDEVTGLTWQQSYSNIPCYWADALNTVLALNKLKYGGYSDWRLPTIKELYSIWNGSAGWPYINTDNFDISYIAEEDLSHAIFWSSNKYTGLMGNTADTPGAEIAFGVNFGTGHIKAYSIGVGPKHLVRCVRGNLAYGVNLFQNNHDGTVTDLATGLMWEQTDSGSGMDWVHALAYAQAQNNANYLGYSDWRLPNVKELQSLVDYSRSPAATNAANAGPAIDPLFVCTAITNEAGNADYPYYWSNTSVVAKKNDPYSNAWYVAFGRAVDGNGEDLHGAGAVRFDAKVLNGTVEGEERVLNYVRLVRNAD